MQSDNKKSNDRSRLQQSVFTKSLAGVLMLGGLAIGANRENEIATVAQEQLIVKQSVQLRTALSVTPGILLQAQADRVTNGQLAGVDQSASFVLAVKR